MLVLNMYYVCLDSNGYPCTPLTRSFVSPCNLTCGLVQLIRVNSPDLVLFVGEALVGNEAVDQLTKFNQALADHSATGQAGRAVDGIVLTKFDTIDDKVCNF